MRFKHHFQSPLHRLELLVLIVFILIPGTLILAGRQAPELSTPDSSSTQNPDRVEAELITVTPNGFEPNEIRRSTGRFLLAIDNRSGLDQLEMHLELETGTRVNAQLSRRSKLAWREVLDLPPGVYVLRAANNESWRCKIILTSR